MILNSQNKKFRKGQIAKGNEDRLINLPEGVLIHILSLLPTKDAVSTSVLSSKWIYLWTNVTTLSFDDHWIYSRKGRNRKERFMNSVDRVLILGSPIIHNFHLSLIKEYDESRVHAWLSAAIRRQAREIHIQYRNGHSLVFPRCLYSSDSLVELNLRIPCTFKVPTSICLSNLKNLQLSEVEFLNECFSRSSELHFSFPLLEVLYLRNCKWLNVKVVNIDAPMLKSVYVNDKIEDLVPDGMGDCAVKVNASNVTKFEYFGYSNVDYILVSQRQSSVIHATIAPDLYSLPDVALKMGLLALTLLKQFSGLKYLSLSSETIKALDHVGNMHIHLPELNTLISLTINLEDPVPAGTFIALLHSFPDLEALIFNWGGRCFSNDDMALEVVPSCFQTHLKVVKFHDFDDRLCGLELAKFVLRHAMVLEEMTIKFEYWGKRSNRSLSEIEAVEEQLLAFPRGSYQASIFFKR